MVVGVLVMLSATLLAVLMELALQRTICLGTEVVRHVWCLQLVVLGHDCLWVVAK